MEIKDIIHRTTRYPQLMELLSYALVAAIAYVDYTSGTIFSFAIFFLIPIFGVAWFKGVNRALLISFVASAAWLISDTPMRPFYNHPIDHVWNAGAVFVFFVLVSFLVSLLRDALNREALLSRTDYMTQLANSKAFKEAADAEIRRARRYGHPISVAYIDLDNFKTVNDTYGHSKGDTLLMEVGATIKKNIRETDLAARVGGDEFTILLPETGSEQAKVVIDKLQTKLDELFAESQWPVGASIGLAVFTEPPESVDQVLEHADRLMFETKRQRKTTS